MASTPFPTRLLEASSTCSLLSSFRIVPSAIVLSSISRRRCLGTMDSGFLYLKLYMSRRFALWISRTSRCPLVVIRPTVTPFLSMMVFMTTVCPWIICSISLWVMLLLLIQSTTAFESSLGVVSTFTHFRSLVVLLYATRSVKAPPMSMPTLKFESTNTRTYSVFL